MNVSGHFVPSVETGTASSAGRVLGISKIPRLRLKLFNVAKHNCLGRTNT